MRSLVVALTVILAFVAPAAAMDTDFGFGGWAGLRLGAMGLDVSGVDDYLEPAGTDALAGTGMTVGGELTGVLFERLVVGFSGDLSQRESSGPDLDAQLIASTFTLDLGCVLFDWKGLRVYPVLGLGAGNLDLRLEGDYSMLPLAEQAGLEFVPLDSAGGAGRDGMARVATNSNVNVSYNAFVVKAALNVDYYHPVMRSDDGFLFVLAGLRAGVFIDAASSGWRIDGEDLHGNEPDFRFNGGFANLAFAFGGAAPAEQSTPASPVQSVVPPAESPRAE